MKKLVIILLTISCIQLLLSCSKNFDMENWEGAVFVSPTNSYRGNDFPNDSARIELLPDSVCIVKNLSFIDFANSYKWPEQFTGEWYLYEYEYSKSLIISYDKRQTSFEVFPFDIEDFKLHSVTLRYYVGDPDDMVFHVLIEESDRLK